LLNSGGSAATAQAYSLDELKAMGTSLPAWYCELYVTERPAEHHRGGRLSDARAWRVQVRAVAQSENNAEEARRRARAKLTEAVITVGGVESTPLWPSVGDDPIAPDSGWYSGLSEFTYYC